MPSLNSQPPRRSRPTAWLVALLLLGVISVAGYKVVRHVRGSGGQTAATSVQSGDKDTAPATNVTSVPKPAAPGTIISPEAVLDKLEKWMAENQNYHAVVETTFPNGAVMGKIDVFAYTNDAPDKVLRVKADIFAPQTVQFQAQKINGKLQVYFPKSDQLVEPDTSKMLTAMPVLAANSSGLKPLLKMARSSFAEASADLEVATLVISSEALKLPETSGDIYLSVRIINQGKLLGIEEQAQGQRVISTVKYLSFDRDLVARTAPTLPTGKIAVTNKTLQKALEEEAKLIINKPLGTKI